MQVLVCLRRHAPAPGRPGQEAQLHQVWLVHVLQGHGLLADGGGQGLQAHGTAAVVLDDGPQHPPVDGVQPQVVDLQRAQGLVRHILGDDAVGLHLGEVPDPAQHPVGDPGRAPAAAGDLIGALRHDVHVQNGGGPGDDLRELLRRVQLQPQRHAEPVPQGRGQLPRPGGGADQGEPGQVQPDGVGAGALAHDDVQGVVLHGRVQDLLHGPVQPVDLVHKEDVPLVEVRQQRRQIPGLLDGRARGDADARPHLLGDDPGQRGLAQAGRAVEQHVVQGLSPLLGGLDEHGQVVLRLLLADILPQGLGPEGPLLGVLLQERLGHDGLFIDVVSKVDAHGFTSSCALNVLQNSGRGGQPAWNRCTASQARPNTAHRHRANTAPLRLR